MYSVRLSGLCDGCQLGEVIQINPVTIVFHQSQTTFQQKSKYFAIFPRPLIATEMEMFIFTSRYTCTIFLFCFFARIKPVYVDQ